MVLLTDTAKCEGSSGSFTLKQFRNRSEPAGSVLSEAGCSRFTSRPDLTLMSERDDVRNKLLISADLIKAETLSGDSIVSYRTGG
jgi:hypothetical protein